MGKWKKKTQESVAHFLNKSLCQKNCGKYGGAYDLEDFFKVYIKGFTC